MTQKLLSIIALLCLTVTSARADVTYSYNESTHTLTISGTGDMGDYDNVFDRPWDGYCSSIKSIVIGNGVTSIGKNAFNNCEFLESITIPANVKSISEYAFYSCQNLTTVIFDGTPTLATIGKYAFRNCLSLKSITIPASVTSIGDQAFMCRELMSVEVYAPSCTLGSDAFKDTKLEKISVPNEKVAAYKTAENWSNYSSKITGLLEVSLSSEYKSVPSIYAGTQNYFTLEVTNNGSEAAENVSATLYLGGEVIDTKTLTDKIAAGGKGTFEFLDATIRTITETTVIGNNNENAVYTVVVKEGDVEKARQNFSFVILYNGNLGKDYAYDSYHPTLREFTFTGDVHVLPQAGSDESTWSAVTSYINPSTTEPRTETFTVSLGEGESVYKALLYASYNWENVNRGTVSSCTTTFNGTSITSIASYRDQGNLGNYGKYGYGMLVYDVTDDVVNGENTFVLSDPEKIVAFYPSSLIVMVNKPSGKLKTVFILEEADMLSTNFSKNRVHSYKSSFDNLDKVADGKATLYVFAASAQAGEGSLKINGETYADVWTGTSYTFDTYVKDVTIGSDGVSVEFISTGSTIQALHQMLVVDLSNRILIETGKPYIVKTLNDNSGVPVNCQTFLPVGYDLSKATVTLKPVKGAPKGLPVIIGSTTDGEVIPADAYLQLAADPGDTSGKITSDDIATDYNSVADDMSKRFVITDGKDNLSKILEGIKDVSASDAIFFVLTNGKFTRVSVSADDLAENANPAKPGLLLFVLTKWEYMNMGSGSGSSGQAGAGSRTIGIGEGGTTGISPIENEELRIKSSAGAWYDLQGRSLNGKPTTKGLYIHQGRKVVMK